MQELHPIQELHSKQEIHTFVFPLSDLRREIEKRSSYLGKMRSTEQEKHLLERFALTEGEAFLSDEYLREAATETYDWIRAFGRGVEHAFVFYPMKEAIEIREHFGACIEVGESGPSIKVNIPLTSDMCTLSYTALGFHGVIQLSGYNIETGSASKVRYRVTLYYTFGVPNSPIEEPRSQATFSDISSNSSFVQYEFFVPKENTSLGDAGLKSVERLEIEIMAMEPAVQLSEGDYICFTDMHDKKRYGVVKAGTSYAGFDEPVCDWYDYDIRDSISYRLMIPHWQDNNMLPKVKNDLREALVNYILWRWFEMVNPTEASIYYDKWEEKAHGAQLGLNAEDRVLQRRVVWL